VKAVRGSLKQDVEVFVPAAVQHARQESHTFFYMHGYVFVEYRDGISYMSLQDTTYFGNVLCESVAIGKEMVPKYSLLKDSELNPMRAGIEKMGECRFSVGDEVRVVKGDYRNLCGDIVMVYDDGQTVQVNVDLRSKKMLIDFPASYLMGIDG
jgi:transcription antitermination factor NusG